MYLRPIKTQLINTEFCYIYLTLNTNIASIENCRRFKIVCYQENFSKLVVSFRFGVDVLQWGVWNLFI